MPQVYPFIVLKNLPTQRAFELETIFLLYPATGQVAHKGAGGYHGSPKVFEAEVAHKGQRLRCIALAPVGHSQPIAYLELLRMAQDAGIGGTYKNAGIILSILKGKEGAPRDMVVLNAGAAFMASGRIDDWKKGVVYAEEIIESGRALAKLKSLVEFTNSFEMEK